MFCGFQNLYPDFCRVGVVLPARIRNTEGMTTNTTHNFDIVWESEEIASFFATGEAITRDGKAVRLVDIMVSAGAVTIWAQRTRANGNGFTEQAYTHTLFDIPVANLPADVVAAITEAGWEA